MATSWTNDDPIWSPGSQLQWFEDQSADNLLIWLRRLVWTQSSHPLIQPGQAVPITYFGNVLKQGTAALKSKIREVVPVLLQEWGRNDPTQCLDDLLVLASNLKCAAAEKAIAMIAREKITGRLGEVQLRQRCLGVLSGFGCSDYTAPLFDSYLEDINYSAYCFRALYRYKLSYAQTTLPAVVATHKTAGKLEALKGVLNLLFFDYLKQPRERVGFWRDISNSTEPEQLKQMLLTLHSLDIVLSVPQKPGEIREIEVIYDYKGYEPAKPGEKIDVYHFEITAFAAIQKAFQAFVLQRMKQAVGA